MSFVSLTFLIVFLPVVLFGYELIPRTSRRLFLICSSIAFYAWGVPQFIPILLLTLTFDFYIVRILHKSNNATLKKLLCLFLLGLSISLLAYYKYTNFLFETFSFIPAFGDHTFNILLPLGISFFTFHRISYVIDVYRGSHPPFEQFSEYLLYILLFPQLIAGPIIKFKEIADQITNIALVQITNQAKIKGFTRFCLGVSKKVLIADLLSPFVASVFLANPSQIGTGTLWLGVLGFAMQIYFDFSGYADMAIGLATILGFKFPENFSNPYLSTSVGEFWRRWHITLGSFLREYLYFPLGGNRNGRISTYRNYIVVFFISGLWHGASWNFVVWGLLHASMIILEDLNLGKIYHRIGPVVSGFLTQMFVLLSWVYFKVENLVTATQYIKSMFMWRKGNDTIPIEPSVLSVLLLANAICLLPLVAKSKWWNSCKSKFPQFNLRIQLISQVVLSLFGWIISLAFLLANGFSPFIYFKF